MEALIGTTWPVFIGVTLGLAGGAALMTGQALARNWRPAWHLAPYTLLLGFADRFLVYGLFDGQLLSPSGYVIDSLLIGLIGCAAFRWTQTAKMVSQYPWVYERQGLFRWRDRSGGSS